MTLGSALSSEQIRLAFEEMQRLDIVIAPWLVMASVTTRLSDVQRKRIHTLAHELSVSHTTGKVLWWETVAVPDFYRDYVYYETLLSSATYLSYMKLGTLVITDEMISVAHRLIDEYLKRGGGPVLLSIYSRIMAYLNGQLFIYYKQVPEEVFVSGVWHRPWTDGSLAEELEFLIDQGLVVRVRDNGGTLIQLTESGRNLYNASAADLKSCGYLKFREQLMRASHFTYMDDYEMFMDKAWTQVHQLRRKMVAWSSIHEEMNVLELGCGTGALTLDDGLYQVVGARGKIIATDPSTGMIARAEEKMSKYPEARNIQFIQSRAEDTPFTEDAFDAVIGFGFLHFTDIPRVFEEMQRVTKSGGTFTTLFSLNFTKQEDFFTEWFEPLFKRGLTSQVASVLPEEGFVPSIAGRYFDTFEYRTEIFHIDFSDVEKSVRFLVGAGTMAELNELPWKARNELLEELIRRGSFVKEKYGESNMKLPVKGQWFRATVKK